MKMKKVLVIGISMIIVGMIFVPITSAVDNDESEKSENELYIRLINQPILFVEIDGLSVTITNIGNETAINVVCEMWFEGLVFIGKSTSAILARLEPGESWGPIHPGLIFGFGPVVYHVYVSADNVDPFEFDINGFMLGSLILGIK